MADSTVPRTSIYERTEKGLRSGKHEGGEKEECVHRTEELCHWAFWCTLPKVSVHAIQYQDKRYCRILLYFILAMIEMNNQLKASRAEAWKADRKANAGFGKGKTDIFPGLV